MNCGTACFKSSMPSNSTHLPYLNYVNHRNFLPTIMGIFYPKRYQVKEVAKQLLKI